MLKLVVFYRTNNADVIFCGSHMKAEGLHQSSQAQSKESFEVSDIKSISNISYKKRREKLNKLVKRHIEMRKQILTKND